MIKGLAVSKAAGRWLVIALALATSACASVGTDRADQSGLLSALHAPGISGARWGLLVVTTDGQTVAEVRADDRFIPASNTKIFTTATAFARLDRLEQADAADGTSVRLEDHAGRGVPDVVLIGSGDPALRDGPGCVADCLSTLADAVASRATRISDVIGDDRLFPDERWGPGWSQEDLQESFGTAVSALTVNDNVVVLDVTSGASVGSPVQAVWHTGDDLLSLEITAVTASGSETDLRLERRPGSDVVRLYGQMPAGAPIVTMRVGLDDPALAAATRFRRLLEQRGVVVEGEVRTRHRPLEVADDPGSPRQDALPLADSPEGMEVARLARPALIDSLVRTAKFSQNLHAELLLRRLGRLEGTGSRAAGLAQVEAMLAQSGVDRAAFDLYDGSGMSAYGRVSSRATTTFLLWTMSQPWGEAWRATLPVGGRDGTLARRFVGTPLEGRIFAKTGSLNGVNALAGFLTAASGRTLVFSVYANDRPSTTGSAIEEMDSALLTLAAKN